MDIIYRPKQNNCHADTLSRQPVLLPILEDGCAEEVQVAVITSEEVNSEDNTITNLLSSPPLTADTLPKLCG